MTNKCTLYVLGDFCCCRGGGGGYFETTSMAAGNLNTKIDSSNLKAYIITNGVLKNQIPVSF